MQQSYFCIYVKIIEIKIFNIHVFIYLAGPGLSCSMWDLVS